MRCIPIIPEEDYDDVWATPDIMLTMRQGHVHDHALLLASMFRAVKYETYDELMESFQKK